MSPERDNETAFHRFFIKNCAQALNSKSAYLLQTEYPLYAAKDILQQERNILREYQEKPIGRIDVIFRYTGMTYMAEIKHLRPKSSFWYATKILAYREYWKFQEGKKNVPKPAIIVPCSHLSLEHRIVAGSLGVNIFTYEKDGENGYRVERVKF